MIFCFLEFFCFLPIFKKLNHFHQQVLVFHSDLFNAYLIGREQNFFQNAGKLQTKSYISRKMYKSFYCSIFFQRST